MNRSLVAIMATILLSTPSFGKDSADAVENRILQGRATEAVVSAAAAIREDPVVATWLRDRAGIDDLLGGPDGITALARTLTGVARPDSRDGEWIVRSVLSLVAMPGADPATERALVASYVVPPLGLPAR